MIYQPYGGDLSALCSSLMKHNLIASLTNTELLPEQGTTSTNKQTVAIYRQKAEKTFLSAGLHLLKSTTPRHRSCHGQPQLCCSVPCRVMHCPSARGTLQLFSSPDLLDHFNLNASPASLTKTTKPPLILLLQKGENRLLLHIT